MAEIWTCNIYNSSTAFQIAVQHDPSIDSRWTFKFSSGIKMASK